MDIAKGFAAVRDFFGLRRSIVGMLTMVVLVGMGEQMAEKFLPLYLLALGGSALIPGFFIAMTNLMQAMYSLPGGLLAERIGAKRALLIFNLMAMGGFLLVILIPLWEFLLPGVPMWPVIFIGSFFFLSWSAISLPATMKLIASSLPLHKRTMGVTLLSLVRRVPKAVGPVVGGAFIAGFGLTVGMPMAFGVALALAVIATIIQHVLIDDDRRVIPGQDEVSLHPVRLFHEMSPSLRRLLVSDILIRFCEQIPYAYVVVWVVQTLEAGATADYAAFQFGWLTAIEMVTAIVIYLPVAYLADKSHKKPFVVITFVFFTLFPLVLMFSHSFWPLVLAFVLRGLKEFGEPTRKALILDLAPEDKKAAMFGLYYLLRDTIVSLAAFGGAFLWAVGPSVNLLTAFGCGVLGTLWFAIFGRDLPKVSQPSPKT